MADYRNESIRAYGVSEDERFAGFLRGVYGWMAGGLLVTAVTAAMVASSPTALHTIAGNQLVFWALFIAQLGIVLTLSARVNTLAPATASLLFVGYAALTGVTLSFLLLLYTGESVFSTFIVTAGTFGALAAYGTVTKRSLSGLGQMMFMGLVGLVLASVVGFFWHSDALQFVISVVGVVVFAGLVAYDAQRLKSLAYANPNGGTSASTIVGALALYLDFINLFLFLLRFMGSRRND
jgi:FtsH-binding integral membrane protein